MNFRFPTGLEAVRPNVPDDGWADGPLLLADEGGLGNILFSRLVDDR